MNKLIIAAALALGASSAFALRGTTPVVITAPSVATTFTTGALAEGQTDTITFTLASKVDDLFIVDLTGASYANTTFALYSGSTLLTPTTTPTGVLSIAADYDGLTVGSTYKIVLSSAVASGYKISSLDKVTDVSTSSVLGTSLPGGVGTVPEPETYALALIGLGVVGATMARRRKQQA